MKKKNYLFILTILLTSAYIGCSENEITEKNSEETSSQHLITLDEAKLMGIQHNEGMAFVLDELNKTDLQKLSSKQKKEKAQKLVHEFLSEEYSENKDFAIQTAKEELKRLMRLNQAQKSSKSSSSESIILAVADDLGDKISTKQRVLLEKIDKIMSNDWEGLEATIQKFNEIENEAQSLPEKDRGVIYVAAEIGKNSAEYWNENLNKWNSSLTNSKRPMTKEMDWGAVGKWDVAGGVGGATGALAVNLIPGAGQVAYTGAIVGGAVAGSVGEATFQILDDWF